MLSERFSDVRPELIPGPAGDALRAETIEEFWDLLFNNEMIEIIVQHTNEKIEDVCARLECEGKIETYHHHTDVDEIRAYIGVSYYARLWKSSDVDVNRLWDKKMVLHCTDVYLPGTDLHFYLHVYVSIIKKLEIRMTNLRISVKFGIFLLEIVNVITHQVQNVL